MVKSVRHVKATAQARNELIEAVKGGLTENLVNSEPPAGYLKIENLYWDPETNEIVVIIEDE